VASPSLDLGLVFMEKRVMEFVARGAVVELQVALGGLAFGGTGEVITKAVKTHRYFCLSVLGAQLLDSVFNSHFLYFFALGQLM